MKTVQPNLANKLVKFVGLESIHDNKTTISKNDLDKALKSIDTYFLEQIANLYKNRVGERVLKGVRNPKQLMCLLRRVLRRHGVVLTYTKRFRKRKAIFNYKLVC